MKVERLIVLVLSASSQVQSIHEDDMRDGYALAVKFLDKHKADVAKNWREIANGAGLEVAGHGAGQIGKHAALVVHCLDGKLIGDQTLEQFLDGAKSCGMYILLHGIHGMVTPSTAITSFLSPDFVAKLVNSMCPAKHFVLLKVNIVGCTLARKPGKGQGGKELKKVRASLGKAGSWSQAFCKALARKETMVAAYTDAVYVVRDNNPEFVTFGVDGSQRPHGSNLGQKAVSVPDGNDTKIDMVAAHRTTVKKVFQYSPDLSGGKVKDVPLDMYKPWGT